MKVYKDFDEVIKPTRIPKRLWEYENEMRKKPNFDKKGGEKTLNERRNIPRSRYR